MNSTENIMKKPTLSKSQYMKGISCQKSLWIYKNRKDLMPDITPELQALFDSGNALGELSMGYFDDGVEVTNKYWDILGGVDSTQQFINNGNHTIYEATAINPTDGAYSRIDILRKVPNTDQWDLIELKGSTTVKDYHKDDLSFQYYVFTGAGYKIRNCYMMLVNTDYTRNGAIDPKKLFRLEDISQSVLSMQGSVASIVKNLIAMTKNTSMPADCKNPRHCEYCGEHIPDYSVYNLFNESKASDIIAQYGIEIENLPDDIEIGGKKALDFQSYKSGEMIIDKDEIARFLKKIQYPIYYLDYETIMPSIPPFDGVRPFQQIPFQFSVHIQHEPNGELKHHEYLHKHPNDPREEFAKKLVEMCGKSGSVVVYNGCFEMTRNRELGEAFPQYEDALVNGINNRIVDLLIPFRRRWLYHPNQRSSASIKAVLPCFTNLSYDNLEIANGGDAMHMYTQFIRGNIPENELPSLWKNLSKYCEQDTYAMVLLLDVLRRKIK